MHLWLQLLVDQWATSVLAIIHLSSCTVPKAVKRQTCSLNWNVNVMLTSQLCQQLFHMNFFPVWALESSLVSKVVLYMRCRVASRYVAVEKRLKGWEAGGWKAGLCNPIIRWGSRSLRSPRGSPGGKGNKGLMLPSDVALLGMHSAAWAALCSLRLLMPHSRDHLWIMEFGFSSFGHQRFCVVTGTQCRSLQSHLSHVHFLWYHLFAFKNIKMK